MFSEPLAKLINETKIKTSLRARGPPGVAYSAYREDRLRKMIKGTEKPSLTG